MTSEAKSWHDIFRFWIFMSLVTGFFWACSDDEIEIMIAGDWEVTYWQVSGCLDSSLNFKRDLDSSRCIMEDSVLNCYEYTFRFGDNNAYTSHIEVLEDSTDLTEIDINGQYTLPDNNTLIVCRPVCDTLIFVREGNILNIITPTDSLSGCGEYIKARRI